MRINFTENYCTDVKRKVAHIYFVHLVPQQSGLAPAADYSQAFPSRRQEQVCLRRHTQRHGVISMLQRCMKHAHIITHSGTCNVCLLLFYQKMRGMALYRCRLTLTEQQRNLLCAAVVMRLHLPGELCIFPHLPLMFPQFNYHLMLFVVSTLCLLCACGVFVCVTVCVCVHCGSHFLIVSSLERKQDTQIHKLQAEP